MAKTATISAARSTDRQIPRFVISNPKQTPVSYGHRQRKGVTRSHTHTHTNMPLLAWIHENVHEKIEVHQLYEENRRASIWFDSSLRYLSQFSLQVPGKTVWNGPSSELDGANLDQNAALVLVALLPLRGKNCQCPGACRTFVHGSFSDGSEGADYGPHLD